MVHRADIAGGGAGPTCPGNDRMCRRALNSALLENNFSLKRQAMLPSPDDGSPVGSCHSFRIRGLRRF